MEEKKTNELSDEVMETVNGGAYWYRNDETGEYEVFRYNGAKVGSYKTWHEADDKAKELEDSDNRDAFWDFYMSHL